MVLSGTTPSVDLDIDAVTLLHDLAYDGQTVNFTLGATLLGRESGAEAVIQADNDGGATGTLTLIQIRGDFLDNERITDSEGGEAIANGKTSIVVVEDGEYAAPHAAIAAPVARTITSMQDPKAVAGQENRLLVPQWYQASWILNSGSITAFGGYIQVSELLSGRG